jgi:hypothetical protein
MQIPEIDGNIINIYHTSTLFFPCSGDKEKNAKTKEEIYILSFLPSAERKTRRPSASFLIAI